MTDALEVVGLSSLTAAAFLLAIPAGLAVLGVACLAMSWAITKRAKK